MFRAILNKSRLQHTTRHQLYGHRPPITKTIQVRRTRHAGYCWRSKDVLISDVLLWTPAYGQAKAGRPARTYIQQLCEDTGCSPEDQPEAMNDREKWRERVRDIHAIGMTWWWVYVSFVGDGSRAASIELQLRPTGTAKSKVERDNKSRKCLTNKLKEYWSIVKLMLRMDPWQSCQSDIVGTRRTYENKHKLSRIEWKSWVLWNDICRCLRESFSRFAVCQCQLAIVSRVGR